MRTPNTTIALIVLSAGVLLSRRLSGEDPQPSLAAVRFENIEIANIDTEAVEVRPSASLVATRTAILRKLIFLDVTIEGVRVQVQPLNGPIHLRANEAVPLPTPISARISYRELESLAPIRRAISSGRARIRATIRAELQLNFFQRMALIGGGAWVVTDVEQTVDVATPGGTLGRLGAMAALSAAEPLWIAGQRASEWRRHLTSVAEEARRSAEVLLVALETRYTLRARNGETALARNLCAGFLAGNHQVVAPAEVAEPWLYDPSIAEAVDKRDVHVDQDSVEILATRVRDSSRVLSTKKKEIRLLPIPKGKEHAISVATKRRYRVRFRNSDSNVVYLHIQGWENLEPEKFVQAATGDWQPAAVMRMYGAGSEPSLWLTEVRIESGRLQLKDPADSTAFGSPVWIEGGIAGMLQDLGWGISAAELQKKLR